MFRKNKTDKLKKFKLSWYGNPDFSRIAPLTQAYGACFRGDGKILIIRTSKNWSLPGGTIEPGEKPIQTLKREVMEEGSVTIKNIIPLGYQKVEEIGQSKNVVYQLRYFALIDKILEQQIDPAKGIIPDRKFINPQDFFKYCKWGAAGKAIMKKAMQTYRLVRNNP